MRQTVGDMARSLLVVFAFIAVLLIVTHRGQPEAIKLVDPVPVVAVAASDASYPVVAPTMLPDEWRPTSARWETTAKSGEDRVLHIGYVTPTDAYAQVSQSANTSAPYLDEQTDGGIADGTQAIGDTEWQRWESGDRRSLVRIADGSATIVSGTATWDELIALAGALQVQTPSAS
jgi:hypothetical protein